MIRILIATGQTIFSEALSKLLSSDPLFEVTAICNDNAGTLAVSWNQQPDIVLLDINQDHAAAISVARKIVNCSRAKIIALSAHHDADYGHHMLGAGATGYITKLAPAAEMLHAVREVTKGNVYVFNDNKSLPGTKTGSNTLPAKRAAQPAGIAAAQHWHNILHFPN